MDLCGHPSFGSDLNRYVGEPNNIVVRATIKHMMKRIVKEFLMERDYQYRIDHELRKVELAQHDEDLLKVLMTTCPPDVEYELHIGGEHIGWAAYDGIKGDRNRVTMDSRIRLKDPLNYVKVTVSL